MSVFLILVVAAAFYFFGVKWALIIIGASAAIFIYLLIEANRDSSIDKQSSGRSDVEIPVSARLQIDYTDGDGQTSNRVVRLSIYDHDRGTVNGFCETRKQTRTFRLDRISAATDMDTGEVLEVKKMRSWLRKHREQ